jgi:GT2 family glycosyltransferase
VLTTLAAAERCRAEGLLRCIVVDNASRDHTLKLIRDSHSWVEIIASEENLGYGRGCNLGFERVTTPYVLFMNADATIEPADLRRLVDFLDEHPRAAVAAPAAHNPAGELHNFRRLPTPWTIIRAALPFSGGERGVGVLRPGTEPFRVSWVPGAALLMRTERCAALGGFDPRFFLYFEETDLLRRVQEDLGDEVWAVCTAVIEHLSGDSTAQQGKKLVHGDIAEHFFQSRLYYLAKHHGIAAAFLAEALELLLFSIRAAGRLLLLRGPGKLALRLRGPLFQFPKQVR